MAKLLIMAGGMSSRMKKNEGSDTLDSTLVQQANTLPKGMIGVGKDGRPFMDYLIYNAHKAGYDEVLILKNPKDQVTKPYYDKLVSDGKAWGMNFLYATQTIAPDREKPAGTADAIQQALEQTPQWKGDRFTVCNSDNLYSVNVLKLLSENPKKVIIVAVEENVPDLTSKGDISIVQKYLVDTFGDF